MKKIVLFVSGVMLATAAYSQVISTFPHTTDFEGQALCGTSCSGSCNPTTGWKNADQYGFPQAGTDWLVEDGSTPSTDTGPDQDHTTGTATGKYFYVETSGCVAVQAHCVSALYDFSASTAPRMQFWWHMYGATMGQMHIDVDTSETNNWVMDVVPSWTANQNLWQMMDISLAAFAGDDSVRIRFRFNTGTSFTSDAAIDDITVYFPLSDDVEAASALAGGGCGNSVCTPVLLDIANMGTNTLTAGTPIPVTLISNAGTFLDTLILAANLLPGDTVLFSFGCVDLSGPGTVNYTVFIDYAADLGPGNDTIAASSIGVPIISTYPYIEDFETGQNGWIINNGPVGTWAFGTPAKTTINSAASGVNAFVTGGLGNGFYNDNDNSFVEGPCFDFTNICDPVIDLNIWWNAEFSWDGMNIMTSTDGGATWVLAGAFGDPSNWYTDNTIVGAPGGSQEGWSGRDATTNGSGGWVNARRHLTGCGNQPSVKVRIYFGTDGSVTDDGVAFDDIKIYNGAYLGEDQTICSPSSVILDANGGAPISVTYAWSTGATTSTITVSTTDWYWVDVTNGACVTRDSMYAVVFDSNSAVGFGADTTLCSPGSITLDAGYWPAGTYLWSDNSTGQTLTTTVAGNYFVEVDAGCGILRDTIVIAFDSASVNLGSDTASCAMPVMLDAGSANTTWAWSTGGTSQMETFSASGTYYVDVMNANGCVASDTVVVTINTLPAVMASSNSPICSGDAAVMTGSGADTYVWVGGPPMATYMVSLTADSTFWVVGTDSATGCFDTASVMISVLQPSAMSQNVAVCYGDSVTVGANTYTMSGTYMDTLTNAAGCDSVITTMLMIDTLVTTSQAFSGCEGYSVTVGSNTYSISGTYVDSLTNGMGCDSIVTTMLTINQVNTGVTVTGMGIVLNANNTSAVSYQWINCANMQPIAGATSSSYTATANGSYAVIIDDGTCTDTSACVPVTDVSVSEAFVDYSFNVFPNPAMTQVTISTSYPTEVVMYNALGEVVLATQVQNQLTLDLTALEGGIYFIRTTEGKIVRFVKQ